MFEQYDVVTTESATPRWMGITVISLGLLSFVAVGIGWKASSHARKLETKMAAQQWQQEQFNRTENILAQRLAKTEDTNEQLAGELSVVTDKAKLTKAELTRANAQTTAIKEDDAKQLADLQTTVTGQLATKASVDDMTKLGTDVTTVKTDLDTTNANLAMTKGEFGTMLAKNHDEIEELRRLGDRDYYEFTIDKKNHRVKVGSTFIELHGANAKHHLYTVSMYVDDARYDKTDRSANEPIYFFTQGTRAPLEFVVNQVGKDKISGYLSAPRPTVTPTHASLN